MMDKRLPVLALFLILSTTALGSRRDLAADVEVANTDLLLLSASSSGCFFRTNDIKSLYNDDFNTAVGGLSVKFGELGIDQAVIDKFVADMNQTALSANDLLQLQLNTFQGYEERVHTYEENLLTNLSLIPENLVQLRKDTGTTSSIYDAVDNNLNTYINLVQTEAGAILLDQQGPVADEARVILQGFVDQEGVARVELAAAKSNFDSAAATADASLQVVANQV